MKIYLLTETELPQQTYRYSFVYLHGHLEDKARNISESRNLPFEPYDLFVGDTPMPTKQGNYLVNMYGEDAIMKLVRDYSGKLVGRVMSLVDYDSNFMYFHEDWR